MNIQRFALGELWTNCYLVWDKNKTAILVDPGGDTAIVRKFIEDMGLKIEYLLLTHGHADHIAGVDEIRALCTKGVAIHEADADCLTDARKNLSVAFAGAFSVNKADVLLRDGNVFNVGELRVEVIHTPGHTSGGVCFYVKDASEELLLCGDTLFARSIGRTDLPCGDEAVLIDSLRKLERFDDRLQAYPGHGPSTTIGEERRFNPYWPR